MAIELYWDDDAETIMLCSFPKHWTWEEMFGTFDLIKQATESRNYEVGAIVDVSQGISIPGGSIFNADTREKARKMLAMGGDNKGPIAIVGANGFMKTIATGFNMLDRSAMDDVYFVDTVREARTLLSRRLAAPVEEPA